MNEGCIFIRTIQSPGKCIFVSVLTVTFSVDLGESVKSFGPHTSLRTGRVFVEGIKHASVIGSFYV